MYIFKPTWFSLATYFFVNGCTFPTIFEFGYDLSSLYYYTICSGQYHRMYTLNQREQTRFFDQDVFLNSGDIRCGGTTSIEKKDTKIRWQESSQQLQSFGKGGWNFRNFFSIDLIPLNNFGFQPEKNQVFRNKI